MKIRQITPAIGAEVSEVHLGEASRDPALFEGIKAALLRHKVLFFRGQDITRAEHVAFARCFGKLEDHPVAGSDPDHPGLVRIYRSDNAHSYENTYHCDGLRAKASIEHTFGAVMTPEARAALARDNPPV